MIIWSDNFKETAKNVNEDVKNMKELIKLDDLEDEKDRYKKLSQFYEKFETIFALFLALDSFSSSSNKSEYKENSREEIVGKFQDFHLILRQKKDTRRHKRSLSLVVRPFQFEPQKLQSPEDHQNHVLSEKGKENIEESSNNEKIVKEFTTKIIDALGMGSGKKEDFSSENLEKILSKFSQFYWFFLKKKLGFA